MAGEYPSTHPPLPPTTEDIRLDWLRLLRSRRVGVTTFYRLMTEHGSAKAALEALPEIARAAGVERYQVCPAGVAAAEYRAGQALGARLVCIGEQAYPAMLAETEDPPPLLWVQGQGGALQAPAIAIVGARNSSSLGDRMARQLASELGEAGFITVSGLARGIDTAAHGGALKSGTIAVFAGGLDMVYPQENAALAQDIVETGYLLSEQPFGVAPRSRHFPIRNRIVSGLAKAVVVIEGAARSGSLITARNALDQGREVMAVPGHPFDGRVSGCNMLIRDGATLVRSAQDVIEALERPLEAVAQPADTTELPLFPDQDNRSPTGTRDLQRDILDRLSPSPVAEDQLSRDLAIPAATLSPALVDLELSGDVIREPGGLIARSAG